MKSSTRAAAPYAWSRTTAPPATYSSAANAVIANNTERKGKTLWTDAGMGDKLTLYTAQNEDDEAQYVAAHILAHRGARRELPRLRRALPHERAVQPP